MQGSAGQGNARQCSAYNAMQCTVCMHVSFRIHTNTEHMEAAEVPVEHADVQPFDHDSGAGLRNRGLEVGLVLAGSLMPGIAKQGTGGILA